MAGRSFVDYALHLAPMTAEHIDEIPSLVEEFGITSFKIFMFYGGHGLHGRSDDQAEFLMIGPGERYDLAHFEFVMRALARARARFGDRISLSLHCETAEIMAAYTEMVEREGVLTGLRAYSASRPPHSEGLAITMASYLAHETGLAGGICSRARSTGSSAITRAAPISRSSIPTRNGPCGRAIPTPPRNTPPSRVST